MPYFATWLRHDRVIAEEEFDDLLLAQQYLVKHRLTYKALGATMGRVWDGRATYFQIE